jgi:hypothetical protein
MKVSAASASIFAGDIRDNAFRRIRVSFQDAFPPVDRRL